MIKENLFGQSTKRQNNTLNMSLIKTVALQPKIISITQLLLNYLPLLTVVNILLKMIMSKTIIKLYKHTNQTKINKK